MSADTPPVEAQIEETLRGISTRAGSPFSNPEEIWHTCPAHEWERIDFDLHAVARKHSVSGEKIPPKIERVTRCKNCGAPRCDAYHHDGVDGFGELSDEQQQFFRCTWERHHTEPHDFLSGVQIEVGG